MVIAVPSLSTYSREVMMNSAWNNPESDVKPDTDEEVPLTGAQDDSMDVDEGI